MPNRRPRLSAIKRSRGVKGTARLPTRSHAAKHASPTTPRKDASVSTSPPAANTILPPTSEHANAAAATMPGARSATVGAAGCGVVDTSGMRSAMNERAGAEVGEQLEQHRVLDLAVEDDDALDAGLERVDAG